MIARTPREHDQHNATHYPGTRQMCVECDEPTERCEDDAIYNDDGEPICWGCFCDQHPDETEPTT